MAPLPPAANILKIQFVHTIGGVPAYVHWFSRYSGSAPLPADAIAIANSVKSAWTNNFAPMAHPNLSLTSVVVTDLTSATGAQGTSGGAAVPGTRTGGPMTANDVMLMNLKIGRRYRGGKPRQYWPFGTATDVLDPQHWTAAAVSGMQNSWNNVQTNINAITWTGGNISGTVNVSYYTLPNTVVTSPTTGRARNVPTKRSTPLIDAVVSASCNSRIATQRRREHFSA